MAVKRHSVEKNPYDSTIPYGMQGVYDHLETHRKICPSFATVTGYVTTNKACMQCHLSQVCLFLKDELHSEHIIEEVKVSLDVKNFYDESTFHIEGKYYVEDLTATIMDKVDQGEEMSYERVRKAVERDVPGLMNNHDPNAIDIVLYALEHSNQIKLKDGRFVKR